MLNVHDQDRLDQLFLSMQEANTHFLGYPFARGFDYEKLWRFLTLAGNNVGDPFEEGLYRVTSHQLEREVVAFFARLFNAEEEDYWGYVTNGGTEGNIYGLYLARELYPDGMIYFSQDTHCSANKAVHLLGLQHKVIKTNTWGEMDYDDLQQNAYTYRGRPAIIVANIGTTMKEAKDDICRIRSILHNTGIDHVYIHCDAALCGPFAPFLKPKPPFDFADGADSITVSGHKFIGAPMPCGVLITRKHHIRRVTKNAEQSGTLDTPLMGSRNAYTPIVLWYALKCLGHDGIQCRLIECQQLASYANDTLNSLGISSWINPGALTIVLPKVESRLQAKWQLVTQDTSRLIIMPGTTQHHVDTLIAAIAQSLTKR